MTTRDATELLYDSEAALRLIDAAIEDIRDPGARDLRTPHAATGIRNGLVRALELIDEVDTNAESRKRERRNQ